jgi:dihydrolipoamide dehydrogenase
MSNKQFDVVVIGGGPGGYVAAIRCAQFGMKTACVDAWTNAKGKPSLGGTCLNVGCIPSKAMLTASENFEKAGHDFAEMGIDVKGVALNLGKMLARKEKIVDTLTGGIPMLFMKNKVTSFHGRASFAGKAGEGWALDVALHDGKKETIEAKNVIVATGSVPSTVPEAPPIDNKLICDNEGGLAFTEVPKRLGVIGAGVIGLELGSVWRRLGSKVSIIKPREGLLREADEDVGKEIEKHFKAQGLDFHMGLTLTSIKSAKNVVNLEYKSNDGKVVKLVFDKLIIAVGRQANTQGLNPEKAGLQLDQKGRIQVDHHCFTGVPGIYAIGDVVRGPMLAHKASEEGVMVAELLAGQKPHIDLNNVPWVIYTYPEISWVGKTEQELKKAGVEYKKGKFSFTHNGRAMGMGENVGFVKFLADAKTDRILGVHMVGPYVSELISEAVVAMEFQASSEDIARIIHAHPSLSEVVHEAALAVDKRAIHG